MSYGIPTAAGGSAEQVPYCPRHPERVSYVRCQRCGRPACTECQRQAAVGIQCVDCVREINRNSRQGLTVTGAKMTSGKPMVTYVIIGLCAVVYALQWMTQLTGRGPGSFDLTQQLAYAPFLTEVQPWRMFTAMFAHSTSFIPHILLNMYSLWILGTALEPVFGRLRFGVLYVVSGLAGSVGVLLIAPVETGTVGASGAIFGLFGALFVLQLKRRGDLRQILVLLVLNGVAGFLISGIAWQAHLGGLIGGALVAFAFLYAPANKSRNILQAAGVIVVLLILTVCSVIRVEQIHQLLQIYGGYNGA